MISIGQLSARTGVKIPTIRYYEQMGLLEAPERTGGNQRRYAAEGLDRLSFIKHARDLGLSIEAIRELIALSSLPEKPCHEAHRIAAGHLETVRERIVKLKRLESELHRIAASCNAGTVRDCRVIQTLSDHGLCNTEH